jgi:hypothetical protein
MMTDALLSELTAFIVRAKAATYVGSGAPVRSCRPASHDLAFVEGDWTYLDSYFGGADFIGQEVIWQRGQPLWAMNYYGYILRPEQITPAQAGEVIKASLSRLYRENRFLGGFQYQHNDFIYTDTNTGQVSHFSGREWIEREGILVYELIYHGGLIKNA